MGAGSLSDILQCLWKAKIRLKKAGNDWTDLLVVNVMASLVYDLEGFQPPAFRMRGWRADSLLYLTPCNFPTTCRVPAGEKGAQGPPPPLPRGNHAPLYPVPVGPELRHKEGRTAGFLLLAGPRGRTESFCNAPKWVFSSSLVQNENYSLFSYHKYKYYTFPQILLALTVREKQVKMGSSWRDFYPMIAKQKSAMT